VNERISKVKLRENSKVVFFFSSSYLLSPSSTPRLTFESMASTGAEVEVVPVDMAV